jgi:hypothetical protein
MPPYERSSCSSLSNSLRGGSSHSTAHLSSSSSSHPVTTSTSTTTTTGTSDFETKSAHDGCVGSLTAVLHFLARQGVSASSIEELQQGVTERQYATVLQRVQEYGACCCVQSDEKKEAIRYLLIGCWTSLCRYLQLQYKQAYKHYHGLRRHSGTSSRRIVYPSDIEKALQAQVALAEQCCACQRELILAYRNEKRMRTTTTAR